MQHRELLEFWDFTYDTDARLLTRDGVPVRLPPLAAAVFHHLISNRDRVVPKSELKGAAWDERVVENNSVEKQVSIIRGRIGESPEGKSCIETEYKRGLRFVARVRRIDPLRPVATEDEAEEIPNRGISPPELIPISSAERRRRIPTIVAAPALVAAALVVMLVARSQTPEILEYRQLTDDGSGKSGPLVSDGRRLFFNESREGSHWIAFIPITGGHPAPVPGIPSDLHLAGLSADRTSLLLTGSGLDHKTFWTYSLKNCSLRLVVERAEAATWDPTKQSITMLRANAMWSVDPERGAVRRMFDFPQHAPELTRSPDGKYLRVWLSDVGQNPVGALDVDSTGKAKPVAYLWDPKKWIKNGVWSRNGKYFLFQAGIYAHQQLWIVKEKRLRIGSPRPVQLTQAVGSWTWPAVGTHDSEMYAINEQIRSELVRFETADGSWKPMWDGVPDYELDYSLDGRRVVFVHQTDHTVWTARADRSDPLQVTSKDIEAHQPHWSPDGQQIAFMGQKPNGLWRIFVVPARGGQPKEIVPWGGDQGVPTWSPDGRFIVFGERLGKRSLPEMCIRSFDTQTGAMEIVRGSSGLWSPRWSPDGNYIVAETTDQSSMRLFNTKDCTWNDLFRFGSVDNVTWSRDSHYIYFDGHRGPQGVQDLYRVSVPDGTPEKLADMRDFVSGREGWYGVSPDGSLLALRGHLDAQIFALECRLP